MLAFFVVFAFVWGAGELFGTIGAGVAFALVALGVAWTYFSVR